MNHYSECFLENENNRKHIYLTVSLFSVGNTKMKRDWDIPFTIRPCQVDFLFSVNVRIEKNLVHLFIIFHF